MISKKIRVFAVHCKECVKILGISFKDLQGEETYCLKCAKKNTKKWEQGK